MTRFYDLFSEFEKLIRHFERKSDFEDAGEELTLFLLELIYSIDTDKFMPDSSEALSRYIAVSVRNQYISLSKKRQKYITEFNELFDSTGAYSLEPEKNIALKAGLLLLSERQRTAIILRYIYGYSDVEISSKLNISRQAVNRLETRGIKILKNYFCVN